MIEVKSEIITKTKNIINKKWLSYQSRIDCNEYKLIELLSYYDTGADAIQKAPIVDYETNCRCVRVGDFTNDRPFSYWGYSKVTDKIFNQYKLRKGDVLVTRTASIGLSKYILEDLNAVYNNGIIRIQSNDNIIPNILGLICQTNDFINYIKGVEAGSSTRPNLKINHLLNYKLKLPSMSIQKIISKEMNQYLYTIETLQNEIEKLKHLKEKYLTKFFN